MKYFPGGLFRCCIAFLRNGVLPTEEGSTISCPHCKHGKMILKFDHWQWDKEPYQENVTPKE